jgi:16S rRNA (uracil1498-N3)-methyltransferase
MRLHRFYVSQPLGEVVVIEDVPTIKQWVKVFRYKTNSFVVLFNGDGFDYTYRLEKVSTTICSLSLMKKEFIKESKRRSFLFISIIKKDLFELVVEKATEHGVTDIIPILTEYTEKKNLNGVRLQTIIKEASEQSGRNSLLTLHETQTLNDSFVLIKKLGIATENTYITTLFGLNIQDSIKNNPTDREGNVAFFIGPEGGWSEQEEKLFIEQRHTRISLGETVLRAETAGIACALLSSII